jgi:hypothetical protein
MSIKNITVFSRVLRGEKSVFRGVILHGQHITPRSATRRHRLARIILSVAACCGAPNFSSFIFEKKSKMAATRNKQPASLNTHCATLFVQKH